MIATNDVPAVGQGLVARVRRAARGRYTLMLSYKSLPGRGRVYFAFSLRHLAELVRAHVPLAGVRRIAGGINHAAVA